MPFIISILVFVFLGSIFQIADNDVWWHLATGKYILLNHAIPTKDVFSFTIFGKPWVSFEWLSQLLFYSIYTINGLVSLTLFKAVVSVSVFVFMIKRLNGSLNILSWIIFALGFIAMRDGLRERPQIFTYLFVSVYMYLMETKNKNRYFLIPILQVFWANMHGVSAFLGIGIAAIYLIFDEKYSAKHKLIFVSVVSVATLLNPHTYKLFAYLVSFFAGNFNSLILEYQKPVISINYLSYFVIVLLCFISFIYEEEIQYMDIMVFVISLVASLLAIRNIPVFIIISAPIVARKISNINYLLISKVKFNVLIAAITLVLMWYFSKVVDTLNAYELGFGDNHKAKGAVRFIEASKITGQIFNDYDFGGYMIWKLYPRNMVFVDGRLLEYGKDFVEKSFYYWKPEIWEDLDKKYNFTLAIIPNDKYYFAKYFDESEKWVLVFWDSTSLVYAKNIFDNKKLIKVFGYKYLKPNALDQSYLAKVPKKDLQNEIRKSCYYSPALKNYLFK